MYGVPDVSVVSMTQHLDMTRAMAERSGIPVVADIDTGFANAINVLYGSSSNTNAPGAACDRDERTRLPQGHQPDRWRPAQDMVRIEEFQGKIEGRAQRCGKDKGPGDRGAHRGADRRALARDEALSGRGPTRRPARHDTWSIPGRRRRTRSRPS
jgi:hypothetical protein